MYMNNKNELLDWFKWEGPHAKISAPCSIAIQEINFIVIKRLSYRHNIIVFLVVHLKSSSFLHIIDIVIIDLTSFHSMFWFAYHTRSIDFLRSILLNISHSMISQTKDLKIEIQLFRCLIGSGGSSGHRGHGGHPFLNGGPNFFTLNHGDGE